MDRWWRECASSARPPRKCWPISGTDSGRTPMGKKPNMSSKHQEAPDPPVPGGEKGRQSVVDTRASSVEDPQPGAGPQVTADPELQAAREDAQEVFARYQRLAADFENYKRRTRQELADRTQYANEELLRKLLPILDNFRRALDHAPEGLEIGRASCRERGGIRWVAVELQR